MNLIPKNERIIVKQDPAKNESDGGIVLPDASKERPLVATVLTISTGMLSEPPCCVGDRILYTPYAGVTTEVTGEELLILRFVDVVAVLQEE